jgi:Mrp family chromosome partitioning ATPase
VSEEENDGREGPPVSPSGLPYTLQRGQTAMALSPEVRAEALTQSGLPANDTSVVLAAALNEEAGLITLSATSRDLEETQTVAENYGEAFREARRDVAYDDLLDALKARRDRNAQLVRRLRLLNRDLEAEFGPLPQPVVTATEDDGENAPLPEVPPGADLEDTQRFFERDQLFKAYYDGLDKQAELAVDVDSPSTYSAIIDPVTTALIVDEAPSPVTPAAIIMLAGLVVGLGAAIARDRLDPAIRSAKVAASSLSAPVLATVPAPRRSEFAVLERPGSDRSEAFRTLGATCVATDRLPKAIVVTSPRGDTLDDVAANFAAALAKLGLKVALVATSPEQAWYARLFEEPEGAEDGAATLPELLTDAHAGKFNGRVTRRLPLTDYTPNLVLVPPGQDQDLALPLDGLPPLLRALEDAGIDVTVVAGPPLLEDPNATIVAWATGTVLWAVQVDKLTQDEASEAAARLELTGVNPFGIVVVGAAES